MSCDTRSLDLCIYSNLYSYTSDTFRPIVAHFTHVTLHQFFLVYITTQYIFLIPDDAVARNLIISGAPARAKRAWDRAPYSWNMVNLFSFGCHVIDRASTDCMGGVGETIKRKGGVSQACLGKSTSLI